MSVNSKMTAIADKIRTLLGLTGTMNLDAMANNLDDANTAVNAALTALTEKGVTVPDGTKVDGLADLIAAIEAGGGSGGGNVNAFLLTFAEDSSLGWHVIEHNSGFVPTFVAIVRADSAEKQSYELISFMQCFDDIGVNSLVSRANTLSTKSTSYATVSFTDSFDSVRNNEMETTLYDANSTEYFKAGIQYLFIFANVEV